MATYLIRHTPRLSGEVEVSTAKNAVLPILAAGLLTEDPLIIKEVPRITDVETLVSILWTAARRSTAAARTCPYAPCSRRARKMRSACESFAPAF